MLKRLSGISLVLLMLAASAQAGVVIELRPDFSGAPFSNGDIVPVEIFISSNEGTIPNIRQVMFDLQSNTSGADSGNIFVDENNPGNFVWDAGLFNDGFWFTDPLPIPQRNYILPEPGPFLFDLTDTPLHVADAFVTYLNDGFFDVTNPDASDPIDEGSQFHSGFGQDIDGNPIRHFSSQNPGEVIGGRVFIPEPATIGLLMLGAGVVLRKKRVA